MNRFQTATVLLAMALPASVNGQTFEQVQLNGLPTMYVLDRAGREIEGTLVRLTDSAIVVRTKTGPRTFTPAEVSLIERKGDSLKNGAIIGAIFGAVSGATIGGDCSNCPGTHVAMALVGAGIWAAIGAGIDALIPGRTWVWPVRAGGRTP